MGQLLHSDISFPACLLCLKVIILYMKNLAVEDVEIFSSFFATVFCKRTRDTEQKQCLISDRYVQKETRVETNMD